MAGGAKTAAGNFRRIPVKSPQPAFISGKSVVVSIIKETERTKKAKQRRNGTCLTSEIPTASPARIWIS